MVCIVVHGDSESIETRNEFAIGNGFISYVGIFYTNQLSKV